MHTTFMGLQLGWAYIPGGLIAGMGLYSMNGLIQHEWAYSKRGCAIEGGLIARMGLYSMNGLTANEGVL